MISMNKLATVSKVMLNQMNSKKGAMYVLQGMKYVEANALAHLHTLLQKMDHVNLASKIVGLVLGLPILSVCHVLIPPLNCVMESASKGNLVLLAIS